MSTAYRTVARPKSFPRAASPAIGQRLADRPRSVQSAQPRALKPLPGSRSVAQIRRLPTPRALPLGLRLLLLVQRSSTAIAAVLVLATLVVYGSTVYTQQLWSKEYRKLKTSQRHERQFVTASEALKARASQQAERPGSGLVPQTPASLLFVQPSAPRPQPVVKAIAPPSAPPVAPPTGY